MITLAPVFFVASVFVGLLPGPFLVLASEAVHLGRPFSRKPFTDLTKATAAGSAGRACKKSRPCGQLLRVSLCTAWLSTCISLGVLTKASLAKCTCTLAYGSHSFLFEEKRTFNSQPVRLSGCFPALFCRQLVAGLFLSAVAGHVSDSQLSCKVALGTV